MFTVGVFADIMSFLVRASIMLDEGVASTLLQLLQCALCGSKTGTSITEGPGSSTSPAKQKKDKDKDKNEGKKGPQRDKQLLRTSKLQSIPNFILFFMFYQLYNTLK